MKRSSIDYHGALAPLEVACDLAEADVLCVSNLMRTGATKDSLARKIGIALRHLQFVWTVFTNRRRKLIVVRDFSNIPLACVFPVIHWMAGRMIFVVNHNLQWTLGSRTERAAFLRLGRMGCRFAFFEQVPIDLLKEYGIDPRHSVALPHPVPETRFKRKCTGGVKTIGLVGQFRPEKGLDELLSQLAPLAGKYRIKLALPNLDCFQSLSIHSGSDWFERVDTSSFEQYLQAVAECDVIILNHPADGYEYRASGLIADAAAAQVPVVVRNLPVLCHQVLQPECVGEYFDELSEIDATIARLSARLANGAYDFASYSNGRSASGLAHELDEICNAP